MSEVKLPPQTSDTDTSNWDDRVFSAPTVKSVSKVKKAIERRQMIPNAPKSSSPKKPKNTHIEIAKK